jgi:hypothetical protein
MTEGMAECGVLRVDRVLVDPTAVWQDIQIMSVMILTRLVIQPYSKLYLCHRKIVGNPLPSL